MTTIRSPSTEAKRAIGIAAVSDLATALATVSNAVAQASAARDFWSMSLLLKVKAERLRDANELQNCLSAWLESLDACERADGGIAESAEREASVAFTLVALGVADQAVEYASRACERLTATPYAPARVRALNALALTQTKLGHYAHAWANYREVVRVARQLPDSQRELWRAFINRGVCCSEQAQSIKPGDPRRLVLQRRIVRLNAVAGVLCVDDADKPFGECNEIEALISLDQTESAMERLSRLRTSIESLPIGSPDRRLFAALVQVLDGSLLCKTDLSRASEALVKGISALEVVGAVEDLPRYLEMLSDVEEARGRYQEALYAARRAGALRLAAARSQSEARLRALEVRFGLDAAQRQIETERSRAHFIDKQRVVLLDETVRLTAATRTDALTGLGNRRLLDELATSLAAPSAMGELAAVAVLDLDHFKAINDRFTHAVGDRVLVEVAKIFRDCCRPKDAVVRLGGEEFAVILIDMSERKAYAVCDRLRATVASYDWSRI